MNKTIKQTEDNFYFLVKIAKKYNADISEILSRPNSAGETAFYIAYNQFRDNSIIELCIQHNVEINNVTLKFHISSPEPAHALLFIRKGINLKIIGDSGQSPLMYLEDLYRNKTMPFPPILERLVEILPNSAYFSPAEQSCHSKCPVGVQNI